jgi:putative DNA primase/helicase
MDMIISGVTGVTGVTANIHGLSEVTPCNSDGVTGVTNSPIPGEKERPCYKVFDDWVQNGTAKLKPGVWRFETKPDDGTLTQTFISSPIHVLAVTHDGQSNNFGRLLKFQTTLGTWREWAMPMEMLKAGGDDLRGELLGMGVEIDPSSKSRNLLGAYLQDRRPTRRVRCALQTGWCGESYVLPDEVFGADAANVTFQSGVRGHDEFTKKGTLDGWRSGIARYAEGNSMLALALASAFVGPLLAKVNAEGGGMHFVGDSSTGKTTLIEAACSIWGGSNYRRSWRTTANGLEGAAVLFNDGLLALDEISECDPRDIGSIVYALGNGIGKQRAARSGSAREVARWKCFILSSGERSVSTAMLEGGIKAKAGQGVRILDIPVGRQFGAWDDLHGFPSGAALSDHIKTMATNHHGLAGRAFLEKLTRDRRDFSGLLDEFKTLPNFTGLDGQTKRGAARFALLAMAGELASDYGVTGWVSGLATEAATLAFNLWCAGRGRGNDEGHQIFRQLSGFIERHGDSRFSSKDSNAENPSIRDRAGWFQQGDDGDRVYLFTSEGLREALSGFDFTRALDHLQSTGVIPAPGSDGKQRAKSHKIAGRVVKLYSLRMVAANVD